MDIMWGMGCGRWGRCEVGIIIYQRLEVVESAVDD
jgi:hypothetical protein